MPTTRTHAQTLQLISAINTEIDFSFNDQLTYFARRFRDDLLAQVTTAQRIQNQKIQDLIYTYAQTFENGLIKPQNNPVFNEALQMFIPYEISAPNLATVEADATVIITATQTAELAIESLVCPDCPRIATLSPAFQEAFAGILTPLITYTTVAFASYDVLQNGTNGCFYSAANPVTVYKDDVSGKYYQFNDRQPLANTFAPDGFYFLTNNSFYIITSGVASSESSCYNL